LEYNNIYWLGSVGPDPQLAKRISQRQVLFTFCTASQDMEYWRK